jgi:hypothetical protein
MGVLSSEQCLSIWLNVASMDFLNAASCRRCGGVFDRMPGDRAWLGFIARCDCDEWFHIMQNRDPIAHVEQLNRLETQSLTYNAIH